VKQIVDETIEKDPQGEPNTNGRPGTRYNANLGRTVGTAGNGSPTTWVRVVVGADGKIITAFPIPAP
jgi:hypothetical protein